MASISAKREICTTACTVGWLVVQVMTSLQASATEKLAELTRQKDDAVKQVARCALLSARAHPQPWRRARTSCTAGGRRR
jgi:hypothetical protein